MFLSHMVKMESEVDDVMVCKEVIEMMSVHGELMLFLLKREKS